MVKFLPKILDLQKSLVKQFQNVPEIEPGSIRKFIKSQSSGMSLLSVPTRDQNHLVLGD